MKTKLTFIIALVFTTLLISSSCEKIEEKIEEKLTPQLSADLNGTNWETKSVFALKSDSGFSITAAEDSTMIILFIKEFKNGKYHISDTSFLATYTTDKEVTNIHVGLSGEIEIIESEDHGANFDIKFNFMSISTLTGDTVYVTNGKGKNIINPI